MGKGGGVVEQKIALTAASGGSFRMGKRAKNQVGIPCSPEGTLYLTGGLIISTLVLNLIIRALSK